MLFQIQNWRKITNKITSAMQYRSIKGYNGWAQLGFLLFFAGAGMVLAALVQFVIIKQMLPAGTTLSNMQDEFMKAAAKPGNVGLSRLMQVSGTFLLMCVPAFVYLFVCHGGKKIWLGFNKYINIYQVLIAFGIMFFVNILATPLADFSKALLAHLPSLNTKALSLETAYNDQVALLGNLTSWKEYLIGLVIIAFLPAFFEEVFFRGALQNLFDRWWKKSLLAILVTSLLFSLIHMSIYLFLSRALLGFALGWMFYRSKNLWVNIIAHFLNNAIALSALFFYSFKENKVDMTKLDPPTSWWQALVAVVFLIILVNLFEKVSAKNRTAAALQEDAAVSSNLNMHNLFDSNPIA
jgi:uncharacterized protein